MGRNLIHIHPSMIFQYLFGRLRRHRRLHALHSFLCAWRASPASARFWEFGKLQKKGAASGIVGRGREFCAQGNFVGEVSRRENQSELGSR
jgi:hypothetical protein